MASSATEVRRPPEEPTEPEPAQLEDDEDDDTVVPEPKLVPWRPTLRQSLVDAWRSRHLIGPLAARAIPRGDAYIMGRGMLFIRPAMQLFGFSIIFGGVFGAQGPTGIPYLVFLIFSLMGWHTFQTTFRFQARGIRAYTSFAKNLKFPLVLLPVAGPVRAIAQLVVYWIFGVVILGYYVITKGTLYLAPPQKMLIGFIGLVGCIAFGWAAGLPIGVLYPKAKEMKFVVRYATTLWMFITPVVYPLSQLHGTARQLAEYNPMTGIMSMVQYGFLNTGSVQLVGLVWSVLGFFLLAGIGLWFFNRYAVKFLALETSSGVDEDDEDDETMM